MATKTWTGSVSTDWFNAGNWNGGTPTSADDAVIGTTVNSPAIGGTPFFTIKSLTINGTDTLTVGDATSGNSVFLTATNGITLSGGGSFIGQGNITGNVTATGAATLGVKAVNGQNTPQLEFFGTITDSGGLLTLSIGNDANSNPDELILTKNSSAHAVNFNGGTGKLTLQDTGAGVNLTVGSTMAIGGGTLFLAGASPGGSVLTDAGGVTIGSFGSILGQGKVAAAITATGQATIYTNGGTLEITGPITDSGGLLALDLSGGGTLLLDAASAASEAIPPASGGILELNTGATLTVGTQMAIDSGRLKLDGSGAVLIDASGVTISNGTITGAGTVNAAVTTTNTAHITATTGTLEVTGAVKDGGSALTMTITGASDKLLIDGTAAAHALSFNNAGGTLEINSAGALTVNTALGIGSGTLKLDGGSATLNDLTVSLGTGAITGAGVVNAAVSAGGAANITAKGGTLEIQHQLSDNSSALTLTINGAGDMLQFDFSGTAHTVNFNGGSGTLDLHNQGGVSFTVGTQMAVGAGTVQLDSPIYTLVDASGITLGGGSIQGVGHINAALSGSGTVKVSGGTLDLQTAIGASAGLIFQIANGATNILQLDGTVGTGNSFAFLGAAGELGLGNDTGFNATISGLNVGAGGAKTNFIDIEGHTVTVKSASGQGTNAGTITLSDNAVLNLTGLNATTWFANTASDGNGGTQVFVSDAPPGTKSWSGAGPAPTDWFGAPNWNPPGPPTSTENAVIGTTINSPTIGANSSVTVNTLTINGTDTLTFGDSGGGNSQGLTATNGLSIGGGGSILGQGSITGNVTATGAATVGVKAVNGQNTPQFEIFGTITDSGNALTLSIGNDANPNPDELILTKNSSAHAVNFNGGTGKLTLQDTGSGINLTVGSQMAIGKGTVFLAGASPGGAILTDAGGATISTGTILGIGKFASALTATGAANIMTNFGLLEISGNITDSGNALTLALANANSGDQLLLDGVSTAHAVTMAAGTMLELNTAATLTIGTQLAIGGNTVKLDGANTTLTDASGLTLSTGAITGSGKITAPVTASGAASITATGGTLQMLGPITDSNDALTMTIAGNGDRLVIGAASTAHLVSFNFASGTLEIGAGGSLTDFATSLSIGSATVQLDGAGAALLGGVNVDTGSIIGAGLVNATVTATGAAHITASGGALELQHQVSDKGNALTLTIAGNNDTLQLDFDGTAHAVSFNGASGTLRLHNQGGSTFTVGTQMAVGTGTVQLDSPIYTLIDASGITLAGGSIQGVGHINAALSGSGTVKVSGGTLDLQTAIGAAAGPAFQIANGATNILQLDSTVGSGNTFSFLGSAGQLALANAAGFGGTISGFVAGDAIDLKTFAAVSKNFTNGALVLTDSGNKQVSLAIQGNHTTADFTIGSDGGTGTLIQTTLQPAPSQSPAVLNDFGWQQGWGSPDNPRLLADVNGDGTADYLGFGFSAVFVGYGGTFANAQNQTGPGFSSTVAAVNDFGPNEGYTASVQRGAAATGAGLGDVLYGQGFAGIYWYAATGHTQATDALGHAYNLLQYQNTPNLYGNFGSQQGWSPANGFQILKSTASDPFASILGFGNAGIVVGPQAFAPGATAANSYVIPFAAGNNSGWNQTVDVRTFTDVAGKTIDLNKDGIADFVGFGPQGLAFAFGNDNGPGGTYQLGGLQNAQINGVADDLGQAQGWTNSSTLRYVVADPQTGFDDILAFGNAGVTVAMGQDPALHNGQAFGQLYLAMADFGANQGWSVGQTPRIIGDVNGDGIPDIVGFGANSTFVAVGSRDAAGNLHFALDPNLTIGDFGSAEGWSGSDPQTVRALADFKSGGGTHSDLVLSGAFNTQVWQFT